MPIPNPETGLVISYAYPRALVSERRSVIVAPLVRLWFRRWRDSFGDADDHREHRRHALFLRVEAPLDRSDPGLHCAKPAFHRSKAAFKCAEAQLQIPHVGSHGQHPGTDPF